MRNNLMTTLQAATHSDFVYNGDVPAPVASVLYNQYSSHTKKAFFQQGEFLYLGPWVTNNGSKIWFGL